MKNLILREVRTMPELETLVELQQAIWGMSPGAAASPYVMMATSHNGGVVIVAEIDGQLVGFCFALAAWRGGKPFLWSHMAGVLPQFRSEGIGFKLKHAHRQWALHQGYSAIHWTFDPIQHGNANFNFRRLGAVANTYLVDHYGEMTDDINAGLASDRLEVQWHLNDEGVVASAEKGLPESITTYYKDEAFILRGDDLHEPTRGALTAFDHTLCFAEVPYQIGMMKRSDLEKAKRWQLDLRWALQEAFERGFLIVDFASEGNRGWYVLRLS